MSDDLKFPKTISLSNEVKHLLSRMLEKDPMKRYSISDVQLHPWINDHFPEVEGRFGELIPEHFEYYEIKGSNKRFRKETEMFSRSTILLDPSSLRARDKMRKSPTRTKNMTKKFTKMLVSKQLPDIEEKQEELMAKEIYYPDIQTQHFNKRLEKVHENSANEDDYSSVKLDKSPESIREETSTRINRNSSPRKSAKSPTRTR